MSPEQRSTDVISRRAFWAPDVFEEELARVFRKSWLFVAHESEIEQPGDYVTRRMANEPVPRPGRGRSWTRLPRCVRTCCCAWRASSRRPCSWLSHNLQIPVHPLPVSWRLPATAAPVVSESFYPFTGFTSATSYSERRVGWNTRAFGINAFDLALETAAESGWALYELPHRHTLRMDGQAVRAWPGWPRACWSGKPHTLSERAVASLTVTSSRVAVGTAHRDQALAVKRARSP